MLSAIVTAALSPAHACGGFFCSNVPVEQQGEDIVFAVDEETDETTVHVQITYTGAAEDFAWIVPIPSIPSIVLSTDRMFQELSARMQPTFGLTYEELFECNGYSVNGYGDYDDTDAASAPSSPGDGGVTVISEQKVGPYETVVLAAETSAALLDWLNLNGYDLPAALDPVLAPYVASESYFVALKLAKDTDTGALAPLALTYPGTAVSVPIQLTSIAATPDMRLHVYVLGESRAVPDSYLHVIINDLVLDWFYGGDNYEDAITVAADEAGGQAFATDYSGTTDLLGEVLYAEGRYDIAELAASPDAFTFFDRLLEQGFVGDSTMLELFREFLPMPQSLVDDGVDEQSFYNCLRCYSDAVETIPFDAPAFAAAIDARIVIPLREAQEMIDAYPHITRLTSSISPVEMTLDPTFVFNADMVQEASMERSATVQMLCGFGGEWSEASRRLVLADGRSYDLPSESDLRNSGIVPVEGHSLEWTWLAGLMDVYALIIEDADSSGDPDVLVDHTADAFADAAAFNGDDEGAVGACGCNGGPAAGAGLGGLLAASLLLRRRRS